MLDRIFISSDIEGTCGICHWDETELNKPDYEPFRRQMTAEVAAACEGATAGGCDGIYVKDALGRRQPNVTADMTYPEVERAIRSAVEDYFKLELGRPEILNRIGENIVVFDFIRREAAVHILRAQVDKIIRRMQELRDVRITVTDEAYAQLSEAALADLSNGGRGIGNQVESLLINPLSRWLFDHGVTGSSAVTITRFDPAAMPPAIDCALTEEAPNA